MLENTQLQNLLEATLLAAGKPLTEDQLMSIFAEEEKPTLGALRQVLKELQTVYAERGIELVQVASGYRFQAKIEWAPWISKLWEERATRYSRALLETLALIAYRQPITRGEIEDIRGVTVSSSIIKTLLEEREWVRVVGHRDVPGKPALLATTKAFLDYFGLKSLQDLPSLPEVLNLESGGFDEAEALLENKLGQLSIPSVLLEGSENVEPDADDIDYSEVTDNLEIEENEEIEELEELEELDELELEELVEEELEHIEK